MRPGGLVRRTGAGGGAEHERQADDHDGCRQRDATRGAMRGAGCHHRPDHATAHPVGIGARTTLLRSSDLDEVVRQSFTEQGLTTRLRLTVEVHRPATEAHRSFGEATVRSRVGRERQQPRPGRCRACRRCRGEAPSGRAPAPSGRGPAGTHTTASLLALRSPARESPLPVRARVEVVRDLGRATSHRPPATSGKQSSVREMHPSSIGRQHA